MASAPRLGRGGRRFESGQPDCCDVADGVGVQRSSLITYSLDLDIGEVADGYHLIARNISLSAEHLLFEFAFVPERTEEAEDWLNMSCGADIPTSQDHTGIGDEVRYARPPLKARYAWFDFFRPDYEWTVHVDWGGSGQFDSDYPRNRVARLTFDLRTGQAQIGK